MTYRKIETDDIQKGDLIRAEYPASSPGNIGAVEYIAASNMDAYRPFGNTGGTYYLMKRTVILPTAPGYYESLHYSISVGCAAYRLTLDKKWFMDGREVGLDELRESAPFRKLVPQSE